MSSEKLPFSSLGERLKELRTQRQASLAEVSGAVEIDELSLKKIESGVERPSEDILVLLLSYFEIEDGEAEVIWKLAGYEPPIVDDDDDADNDETEDERAEALKEMMKHGHTAVMMMAFDPRIVYSDGVDVTANKQGVVLNFTQSSNNNTTRTPISKIGMSYEQAQAVLEVLHKTLEQAKTFRGPKRLPPQSDTPTDKKNQ